MKLESGQVAVVTGGASGLGFGLAQAFAARGLHVVVGDVETAALADAVARIEIEGGSAIGVLTDVRFAEQLEALASATIERFGRVDVICNNAGVVTRERARTWEVPLHDWQWVLRVNLDGVFNGIHAFVPHLIAQNSGHVVNTASMAGISTGPGHAPYMASKHAVVAMSEGLAAELAASAPNVGVTIVCPGGVLGNMATAERNRPPELQPIGPARETTPVEGFMEWCAGMSGEQMLSGRDAAELVIADVEANKLHSLPNGSRVAPRAWIDRLLADLPAT